MDSFTWKCDKQCGAYPKPVSLPTNSFKSASSHTDFMNVRIPPAYRNTGLGPYHSCSWSTMMVLNLLEKNMLIT